MRKLLGGILFAILVLALAACGAKDSGSDNNAASDNTGEEKQELTKIAVGASNTPHAVILEQAQPLLEEKGIELVIETYQDYVLPNKDLESKELDANFFQHIPYLDQQVIDHGYQFANAGAVHIEPMAVYSQEYESVEDLPEGATIIFSNSVAEHGRVLSLLESAGLIKLAEGVDKVKAEVKDIVENPKNLKFDANYEPALLPQLYNNDEGDAVVINANYAIDAGLNPVEDSIVLEDTDSPYANIIVVREGEENNEAIKTLVEVLTSKEIQDFISEEWKGSVVPVK
ncbi:MetQ/NlpA family ABC transporter substrate-binding protein [Sporosarcina sp. HYO08]|uniref:MetQ/NlpA family ABC transporter substrate-binding protein n=1 Tax=Sporosarcina sp. HYO08 TaxID=1759557 RepID=UPI0007958288|nr:MetQ/NlpA family ABC transporter substrate-binding protein [Sporosarcina sp. HYO08]KXH79247.1 methionine ABC transporter substrate-binding protein [Sporosarcina sp. HYO08]